jgi:myo-inositol-hexaphosphate 3-phosphohydrolase
MSARLLKAITALLCFAACVAVQARDTVALGAGGRLELDKKALSLVDGAGKLRATLPMRASQLDVRAAGGTGLAVVLDSATQHAQLFRFDVARGSLVALTPLPLQSFGVESLCLFRDRQQVDQLFIAGKDGQAEQWLLDGDRARLVRKLSMPPDAGQCKVDDAAHTLYIEEEKVGTWAYEADSEATPTRSLLKRGARVARDEGSAMVVVQPRAQTEPVARLGDVADDPAIWVNRAAPANSRVLGTNKKQGLMVYDMQGRQTQFLASGRLNNVDLRQGVTVDGKAYDLAVASQRDDNTVVLYGIDSAGSVAELARFATGLPQVYGICLFQPRAGGLEVIVNDKSGTFRQFGIGRDGKRWTATLGRQFKVGSQPEGCVADDRNERLFLGEEKVGVWTMAAGSAGGTAMHKVLATGKHLRADVEGLAIYHGARGAYLVVSSQGDSSYVVLDAVAPYKVRGRFRVGFNLGADIDGTSETDGLEVTSADLGGAFGQGMLVIQDGYKRMPDGPQNFKYVSWEDVARALHL